jgi:hypothetical protein
MSSREFRGEFLLAGQHLLPGTFCRNTLFLSEYLRCILLTTGL